MQERQINGKSQRKIMYSTMIAENTVMKEKRKTFQKSERKEREENRRRKWGITEDLLIAVLF